MLFIFIFCFLISQVYSQEVLSNLSYNAALFYKKDIRGSNKKAMQDTVNLPFMDDFSKPAVYPDSSLWLDRDVFINRSYPVNPPSIGVATLDGLNEKGEPYNYTNFSYGAADTLTSNPIALGAITSNDSVFLSFFYQPEGIGDYPDTEDSLLLEFKDTSNTWITIWSIAGDSIYPFKQVLIPVMDTIYLFDGFQFRFRNYATLSGNNDHWHIDYVRMDSNRHANDTTINDVAIVSTPVTLLKNYTAMPWAQYINSELDNQHITEVRNNFGVSKNITHQYSSVYLKTLAVIDSSNAAGQNINPLTTTIVPDTGFYWIDSIPAYLADSVLIRTVYTIANTGDNNSNNDSIYFDQRFYNYYAYDDGSAEMAYGLFSIGAKLAYRFTLNYPDTLRAVAIHFAHMNANVSNKLFSLTVWQSIDETNSGAGDNMIYQQYSEKPHYIDTINRLYIYGLDTPQVLSGTFYIGWVQESPDILNIGFDVNTDSKQHIFYNTDGTWKNSSYSGSLMMRPLLGKPILFTGIIEKNSVDDDLRIYPNPAYDRLYISFSSEYVKDNIAVEVYDIYGRLIFSLNNMHDSYIDVAAFPSGIYLLKAFNEQKNRLYIKKFVINHR